jgi:hypothetical protein
MRGLLTPRQHGSTLLLSVDLNNATTNDQRPTPQYKNTGIQEYRNTGIQEYRILDFIIATH